MTSACGYVEYTNFVRGFVGALDWVFVDGGDKYHVESCEPPVSGMDELVTQLNTNNDFAAFVRAMRKRFKALA